MKPTYYLNLQVCCQEDDKGWEVISEQLVCKSIDKLEIYETFNLIKDLYKHDDSLLVEDANEK